MKPSAPITHVPPDYPADFTFWTRQFNRHGRALMLTKLLEIGTPEKQVKMKAAQLWQWIYQKANEIFPDVKPVKKLSRTTKRKFHT